MRRLLLISVLPVLAAAIPHPQAAAAAASDPLTSLSDLLPTATTAIPDSTSLNIPITPDPTLPDPDTEDGDATSDTTDVAVPISRPSKKPHQEPVPIFTRPCLCDIATVRYPCWATDPLQKCRFEESFSYACYMQAAGGCPKPTRSCSKLFQPTPLPPGAHPCELKPNPHVPTSLPVVVVPPFPTLSGLPNVTLSWPTASGT